MDTTIVPTGQQRGSWRYGPRFEGAPPIANWRANLTGLSQVHNLYFIAYGADIHVYEPQFPIQKLTSDPVLTFTSQPSASRLPGYIDRRHPHHINNLVIDFLGNEEVVAVVRDDGDVDAFLVRHVIQTIERRAEASSTLGREATEIRPFFQNNVGISAWGLAVHAEARIIATSSNLHQVQVFKFGLVHTNDESRSASPSSQDASELEDADSDDGHGRRHSDVTHHIINGESNIPYIAFCNTGDDPEGRWLLTTDISGVCRVMDLRRLKSVQTFQFGRLLRDLGWSGFDRINAGWILMFLDRRSFNQTTDVCAALGLEGSPSSSVFSTMKRKPSVWDLSRTVQRLPECKQPFVYHRIKKSRQSMDSDGSPRRETARSADSEADEYSESADDESDGGTPLEIEADISSQSGYNDQMSETSTTGEFTITVETSSTTSDISNNSSMNIIDDAEDPDDEMTEDTISFNDWYNGDTIAYNVPYYATDKPICDGLPCPILHASCRNIYLLQPSDPEPSPDFHNSPLVGLSNPLRQRIQQDFEFLSQHQRLNMAVSIPTLGVVVVASQKGRAMVLSLSKLPANTTYPPEMLPDRSSRSDSPSPTWSQRTTYAMRVECILPFASQEKANQRPFMPLHGIAASPLQGCEADSNQRTALRWRLMMMYQDHSILSYEISRSRGGEAGKTRVSGVEVNLESVVV